MKMTIQSVFPQVRNWGEKYPDNCSVGVIFSDGSQGEIGTKKSNAESIKMKMHELEGQEAEFTLEPRPDYMGQKQWKIVSYPGKQEAGGRGGGGNFQSAWRNTEPGFRFEQDCMMVRTALMQATQFCSDKALPSDITATSDTFLRWLRTNIANSAAQNGQKVSEPQNGGKQPVRPNGGHVVAIWEGPGQCPECRCPAGVKHATKCPAKGAVPTDTWADETDPFVD